MLQRDALLREIVAVAVQQDMKQRGGVARHGAGLLIDVPQIIRQLPHHAGRIAESVQGERVGDGKRAVRLQTPCVGGSHGEAQIADRQILQVSVISPVCVQIADGSICETVLRRIAQVVDRVVGASGDGVPGRGSRTDIEGDFRLLKLAAVSVKGVIRLIAPLQRDGIGGQFRNQFRAVQDDVAPEHHRASSLLDQTIDFQQKVEIDPFGSSRLALRFAAPLT
jgi:hypothetical protein